MNFALLRGWCGQQPTADATAPPEPTHYERMLTKQAEALRADAEALGRQLEAEIAENQRLVALLVRARRYEPGAVGTAPVSIDDAVYWRAEAERHKATAAKLDNLLAAAERRPPQMPSRWPFPAVAQ